MASDTTGIQSETPCCQKSTEIGRCIVSICPISSICAAAGSSLAHKAIFGLATIIAAATIGHFPTVWLLRASGHPAKDRSGRWIGFVERALVATLVLMGFAAQSTFIFATKAAVIGLRTSGGDQHKKKTSVEYMMIGTMTSFLVALLVGFLGKEIWGMLR